MIRLSYTGANEKFDDASPVFVDSSIFAKDLSNDFAIRRSEKQAFKSRKEMVIVRAALKKAHKKTNYF
jgi:hypothetical protein